MKKNILIILCMVDFVVLCSESDSLAVFIISKLIAFGLLLVKCKILQSVK